MWWAAALSASAQPFSHAVVAMRADNPTLLVDGRPFFFYGAAFFYERIPARRWRASMLALRGLGFNTLDLYVPWNWHEIGSGDFDFDGRTNAQRNLRGVLALARELRFHLVVRPGPVIRNEWRNGGYPEWLLRRPEYGMPLHDILEGRYPATATLQNANSDDAAAQWLANATHRRYAARWLRAALREFVPYADLVLAVQLDDDQGAYIDNQTWPAPHLRRYLRWLETNVRAVVGARLPVFINTYEMKVTASAPVWAMGNWYQSDAYAIGEHDRRGLEFSAGLLQTQNRFPVAMSEFQAGWLAPPEDPAPRPADPANTTLALHTLLGMGARGAIVFPAQDTINPAGWEAPFANAAYRWDAALDIRLARSARYAPTARFGALVARDGGALAASRRVADGAIAYLASADDPRALTIARTFAIAARTMQTQQACRAQRLTCDLVDLRFVDDRRLARYAFLVVPSIDTRPFVASVDGRLRRYRAGGGRIVSEPPRVAAPRAGGLADATLLVGGGRAFLDLVNYGARPRPVAATRLRLPDGRSWTVGPLVVPARDAILVRAGTPAVEPPVQRFARAAVAPIVTADGACGRTPVVGVRLAVDDCAADGYPRLTIWNDRLRVTVAPHAGARLFGLALAGRGGWNVATSVGALRDDVAVQPPVSTTDRIGKYTRTFAAGMFNRPYALIERRAEAGAASATLAYSAPDVVPAGARFVRTLTLRRDAAAVTVAERVVFGPGSDAARQRPVRYDSFDTRGARLIDERVAGGLGWWFPARGCIATVTWPPAMVERATLLPQATSTVLRLRFRLGFSTVRYGLQRAGGYGAARAALRQERLAAAAKG